MADPEQVYRDRAARFAAERDRLAERSRRVSHIRIIVFLAALGCFVQAELADGGASLFGAAGGLLAAGFIALIVVHDRIRRELREREEYHKVNIEAGARRRREWAALPGAEFAGPGAEHLFAIDLDLFGRASLFQLLGTIGTAPGRTTLRDWLTAPAPPAEIRARQTAVAEIAPLIDLRDAVAVRGRLDGGAHPGEVERFLEWAEDEPWLLGRPALVRASRLIPLVTVALAAAQIAGLVGAPYWALSALLGLTITWRVGHRIRGTYGRAFARKGAFARYAGLFDLLAGAEIQAPRLRAIQAELTADGLSAVRWMRRLERIMELADLRFSALAHFPVHAVTLWDFHVLYALERWQVAAGRHARRWLGALGEAEAIAALGALAFDNPDWAFPAIVEEGEPLLTATAIGHPLLRHDVRVANNVAIGPPGTFLLVTGSNMSGKSTLLRAVGTNVVLAQAGGPVCAREMRLPPVALATSMRVQDSLEQGVSYFMAELRRLKQVVDTAREGGLSDGRTPLYLLDEILHGTNTAERQVAAQRVIAFLVSRGAIGAVSTHDLALADADALAAASRPVHFVETVRRDDGRLSMSFDYRLRPGVATSTNALKLMEIVGLGLEETAPNPA